MASRTRPWRTLGTLAARPPELRVHIGFNGLAQLAPLVVILALTPLLLSRLGLDRFGIWSLALVVLRTLTALDGGVSASLGRFFAIYAARGDREDTGRLLLSSLLLYLFIGLGLTLAAFPLAPALVGLVDVPVSLEGEAVWVFRWLPLLVTLALIAGATAALLQGNGQFRALAAAMSASSGAFAIAVIVFVQPGADLRPLIVALALRYVVLAVASVLFAMRHVSIRRPLLPSRAAARELLRYGSRMQLSAVAGMAGSGTDALVIAAVLPVRYVGLFSIGQQAASAARSLPLYAFAPLVTRLTTTFRNEGREAAAAEFARLERKWLPAVLGYGVIAVVAIGFSVTVWLGKPYQLSGITATVLLAGSMVHVAFTGMRTCYVRAVGRPGLETRYGLVWTLVNALLTIPLVFVAGVVGVAAATSAAAVLASAYFMILCRREEQLPVMAPARRWWPLASAVAGITLAGELIIVRTDLHGFLALALTGLPALFALVVFAVGFRQAPLVRLAA